MKLRCYDNSDSSIALDRKQLQRDRPRLFRFANTISIESIDRTAYDLLESDKLGSKLTVKIGFGATGRATVNLRNLTYAAIALALAQEFGSKVEFVSGSGISSTCRLVRYEEVEEQVRDTFALLGAFASICFPSVDVSFSVPTFIDLDVINHIIKIIETNYHYARIALGVLGSKSKEKGKAEIQGKQYAVLHAFAFDLGESQDRLEITVGNSSEDYFNCVRFAVLREIRRDRGLLRLYPPLQNGYIITNRCEIPPYAPDQLAGWYELQPTYAGLEYAELILKKGRRALLEEISDQQKASVVGSVIKDIELLLHLVGLERIRDVVDRYQDQFKLKVAG